MFTLYFGSRAPFHAAGTTKHKAELCYLCCSPMVLRMGTLVIAGSNPAHTVSYRLSILISFLLGKIFRHSELQILLLSRCDGILPETINPSGSRQPQ